MSEATVTIEIGDRARLWLGPPKRGSMRHGEVIGVDNQGNTGIQIRFDRRHLDCDTCYATHAEVEVEREVRIGDREIEVLWLREGDPIA